MSIRSDGVLERIAANAEKLPGWMPAIIRRAMLPLRETAVDNMRTAVEPNRYTGALSDSITGEFSDGGMMLTIGPTALRGSWDAGAILELGTKPIPNAPWAPLRAWAEFRGLPAFPVWHKIRTQGVAAHPFLERTRDLTEPALEETARRIVEQAAQQVLFGSGTVSA